MYIPPCKFTNTRIYTLTYLSTFIVLQLYLWSIFLNCQMGMYIRAGKFTTARIYKHIIWIKHGWISQWMLQISFCVWVYPTNRVKSTPPWSRRLPPDHQLGSTWTLGYRLVVPYPGVHWCLYVDAYSPRQLLSVQHQQAIYCHTELRLECQFWVCVLDCSVCEVTVGD